jgi:hypothetical protein
VARVFALPIASWPRKINEASCKSDVFSVAYKRHQAQFHSSLTRHVGSLAMQTTRPSKGRIPDAI